MNPTLHKSIPMGTRVIAKQAPESDYNNLSAGTVIGISSMYVIFDYIVLLDEPIQTRYGIQKAISIPGTWLVGENGESFSIEG